MPITPVYADEYEGWKKVWAGFIAHMSASLPESQYEATWTRIRKLDRDQDESVLLDSANGDIGCLVARDDDGQIIGVTHWLDFGRTWKENKEVYMEDLFVFPAARGRGYGKQLIMAVAAQGAKQGSDAMHWTTGLENVWSARMYDSIGKFNHRWYSMDLPYKPQRDDRNAEGEAS